MFKGKNEADRPKMTMRAGTKWNAAPPGITRGGSDLILERFREKRPRTTGHESNRSYHIFVIWHDPAEAHSGTNAIKSEKHKYAKYAFESPANWGMDKVPGTTMATSGKLLTGGRKPIYVEGRKINPRTTIDTPDLEINHENRGLVKADPLDLKQIFIKSVEGRHCCLQIKEGMDVLELKKEI